MSMKSNNQQDLGPKASLLNIRYEAIKNKSFRRAIWTGEKMQVTVMSIPVGGEIGVEMHESVDQLIKVEQGCADIYMGDTKQDIKFVGRMNANYALVIPSGVWHNVVNACSCDLKVYSVYAPPNHPYGTVHQDKKAADAAEDT